MDTSRYLIVGGGMTGDAACAGIREHDSEGSIILVGTESHPPYKRPPLTKGLWAKGEESSIWRKTDERGVDLRLGRTIVDLNVAKQDRDRRPRRHLRVRARSARDWRSSASAAGLQR